MRKKIVSMLLGGVFLLSAAGNAQAMTRCVDLGSMGEGQSSVIWSFTGSSGSTIGSEMESIAGDEVKVQGQCEYDSELVTEYGDPNEMEGLSKEEKKKLEDWHREEMRESIAYLDAYGVSYDENTDTIMYQGKTVRWLIDRQMDDTCRAIQMPEGEIDLYTVRSEDFKLTGVRIASEEEYEERTENGMNLGKRHLIAEDSVQSEDGSDEETTEASYSATKEEREEWERKVKEYENAGIGLDEKNNCWIWQKQPIYFLADEDGSLYQNGSDEAIRNRVYVIVKRNSDGSIKETKQVTMEEIVEEKMLMDQ